MASSRKTLADAVSGLRASHTHHIAWIRAVSLPKEVSDTDWALQGTHVSKCRSWESTKERNAHAIAFKWTMILGSLKCCFTSTETVGLLGTGAQDGILVFHTAPEL